MKPREAVVTSFDCLPATRAPTRYEASCSKFIYCLHVENIEAYLLFLSGTTLKSAMRWVQMTGILLVAGTVLLKWSFVAPYITDRIATWTMTTLFPFVTRDILMAMFLKSQPCQSQPKPRLIKAQHSDSRAPEH